MHWIDVQSLCCLYWLENSNRPKNQINDFHSIELIGQWCHCFHWSYHFLISLSHIKHDDNSVWCVQNVRFRAVWLELEKMLRKLIPSFAERIALKINWVRYINIKPRNYSRRSLYESSFELRIYLSTYQISSSIKRGLILFHFRITPYENFLIFKLVFCFIALKSIPTMWMIMNIWRSVYWVDVST